MPRNQSSSTGPLVAVALAVLLLGLPALVCGGWFVLRMIGISVLLSPTPPPAAAPITAPIATPPPVAPPTLNGQPTQLAPVEMADGQIDHDGDQAREEPEE